MKLSPFTLLVAFAVSVNGIERSSISIEDLQNVVPPGVTVKSTERKLVERELPTDFSPADPKTFEDVAGQARNLEGYGSSGYGEYEYIICDDDREEIVSVVYEVELNELGRANILPLASWPSNLLGCLDTVFNQVNSNIILLQNGFFSMTSPVDFQCAATTQFPQQVTLEFFYSPGDPTYLVKMVRLDTMLFPEFTTWYDVTDSFASGNSDLSFEYRIFQIPSPICGDLIPNGGFYDCADGLNFQGGIIPEFDCTIKLDVVEGAGPGDDFVFVDHGVDHSSGYGSTSLYYPQNVPITPYNTNSPYPNPNPDPNPNLGDKKKKKKNKGVY